MRVKTTTETTTLLEKRRHVLWLLLGINEREFDSNEHPTDLTPAGVATDARQTPPHTALQNPDDEETWR